MFGIGGSEILVILVVALLFLGPDKLPDAAKQISKGIRDLKKQGRVLQQTIENDEHIGGAIRDLKSALRGDELPVRPPVQNTIKPPKPDEDAKPADTAKPADDAKPVDDKPAELAEAKPAVTLPPMAGEAEPVANESKAEDLAELIKPPPGETAARGTATPEPESTAKQKHG